MNECLLLTTTYADRIKITCKVSHCWCCTLFIVNVKHRLRQL